MIIKAKARRNIEAWWIKDDTVEDVLKYHYDILCKIDGEWYKASHWDIGWTMDKRDARPPGYSLAISQEDIERLGLYDN